MTMIAYNVRASGTGDALHLFPGYPPYARAKTLNPERRDAHQEMVMRVSTRRQMAPSGTLDPATAVGIAAVIDREAKDAEEGTLH